MIINGEKINQVVVKTEDGELIVSITDEDAIIKDGYAVEYEPLDD